MIICHTKKIIFIKTKKTGGTSFEIALSKYCSSDCIITPISPNDEKTRKNLGFGKAQNYENYFWKKERLRTNGHFINHLSAANVKNSVPPQVWAEYKKITIVRNPYDVAISRYFYHGGEKTGMDFLTYLKNYPQHLKENEQIAPLTGLTRLDFYLRYECLETEFRDSGLDFMWKDFTKIKAKANTRPKEGASITEMFQQFPSAAALIQQACDTEIKTFGYKPIST